MQFNKKGDDFVLVWFFTAVYFLIFFFIIGAIGNEFFGTGAGSSFLAIFCWIIAFFVSVGLGEFTEKKIKEHYSKKQ